MIKKIPLEYVFLTYLRGSHSKILSSLNLFKTIVGCQAFEIFAGGASEFLTKYTVKGAHGIKSAFYGTVRDAMFLLIHQNECIF